MKATGEATCVNTCEHVMELPIPGEHGICERSILFSEHTSQSKAVKEDIDGFEFFEDQTSAKNQRLTVKNTFIHVEFEDLPEASTLAAASDLVASAGIIFTACGWY